MKAESKHTTLNLEPAIAQMRRIAAEAGDHLLLGDGAPNPDAILLGMCAEATQEYLLSREAEKRRPAFDYYRYEQDRPADEAAMKDYWAHQQRGRSLASRATKLRATTPEGIYAKAMVVRASKTGVALLGVSLAEDLLNCRALRETLGLPAEPEPVPPANVVPLRTVGARS